jgi:hypothetical protein
MGANRIDHRSLLADKQVAGAMQHQAALLLGGDLYGSFDRVVRRGEFDRLDLYQATGGGEEALARKRLEDWLRARAG